MKSAASRWSVISLCLGTLFLLQGTRELVGSTYNLNLATMSVNGSIVAVLAFFAPLLLFFGQSRDSRQRFLLFALLVGAARIAMSLDPPVYAYLGASALLVVFSGLFLPLFFSGKEAGPSDSSSDETSLSGGAGGRRLMMGLVLAVGLDIMLRTLGNSFDVTVYGLWGQRWQSIVFVLPLVLLFLFSVFRSPAVIRVGGKTEKTSPLPGAGLGALAFLYFLLLGFPSGMARWTGGSYPVSAALSSVLLCLYAMSLFIPGWGSRLRTSPGAAALSTVFFSALLVLLAYPQPLVMTVLLPLALFCSLFMAERLLARAYGSGVKAVAAYFLWAALAFVLLTVMSVMCLTWAHVPGMTFLRDKMGWLVAIAALVTALLSVKGRPLPGHLDGKRAGALLCLMLIAGTSAGALYYSPSPAEREFSGELRVMTYNIHQGYGMDGKIDPWAVLAPIEEVGPDVLILQESDTNRPSSTNVDIVGWLARELDMHVYFGPDTGEQIYGVAILSRYTIYDTEIYYLDSEEDQRVLLRGEIRPGGCSLAVYAVHMGLSPRDRTVQTNEILDILDKEHLPHLLGGDFNSLPNGTQMANFTNVMGDTWALAGRDPLAGDAYTFDSPDPYERIDYILVSRDLAQGVERTEVIRGVTASDHLPVWTRLRLQ